MLTVTNSPEPGDSEPPVLGVGGVVETFPVGLDHAASNETEPRMSEPRGELTPTSSQIGVAIGLAQMHTRSANRQECAWCFRVWPCPDRRWSDRILRLAREARGGV